MKNRNIKILRPSDFSQEAYLERRKKYNANMEKYLEQQKEDRKRKKD